jgi:hypothetical protein
MYLSKIFKSCFDVGAPQDIAGAFLAEVPQFSTAWAQQILG